MKIKVHDEERTTKTVYLRLVETAPNTVALVTVDENGVRFPSGTLLVVTQEGKIRLPICVNSELGFMQDDAGRVVVERNP